MRTAERRAIKELLKSPRLYWGNISLPVHKHGQRMVSQKIPPIVFIIWVLILAMQSQFTATGLSYSNKQQGRNIHVFLPWKKCALSIFWSGLLYFMNRRETWTLTKPRGVILAVLSDTLLIKIFFRKLFLAIPNKIPILWKQKKARTRWPQNNFARERGSFNEKKERTWRENKSNFKLLSN